MTHPRRPKFLEHPPEWFVTSVLDGDTIEVRHVRTATEKRVRLIGIDAPEIPHEENVYPSYLGSEAIGVVSSLLLGKTVYLIPDGRKTDGYGRHRHYVWLAELFVNLWLVRQGYARESTPGNYPPCKYRDCFLAAEAKARKERRGVHHSNRRQSWMRRVYGNRYRLK